MEIVFLWIGLLFISLGVLVIHSARRTSSGAQRFEGEVLGHTSQNDKDDGSPTFAPVVRFRHPRAGSCVFEHPLRSNTLPAFVGQKVRLIVAPETPMRARLDTSGMAWFGAAFVALGLVPAVVFFSVFRWSVLSVAASIIVTIALVVSAWRRK